MKTKKIVIALIILLIVVLAFMPKVNARYDDEFEEKHKETSTGINPDDYDPAKHPLTEDDYELPFKFAGNLVGPITTIGIVISVTMTMILGIKYMIGSTQEKSEYKKNMVPMLIGAILLFTSSTIVSIIYSLMQNV